MLAEVLGENTSWRRVDLAVYAVLGMGGFTSRTYTELPGGTSPKRWTSDGPTASTPDFRKSSSA
jgi:hypothetical protein